MSLCVVGPQDLDEVECLVREYFGKIPDRGVERPWYGRAGSPWSSGSGLAEVFRIIPVKENAHEIHLTFPLPSMKGGAEAHNALPGADPRDDYRKRVDELLAHLVGYEGEGSLLSWLRRAHLPQHCRQAVGRTVGAWSVALLAICSVSALSWPRGIAQWKVAAYFGFGLIHRETEAAATAIKEDIAEAIPAAIMSVLIVLVGYTMSFAK